MGTFFCHNLLVATKSRGKEKITIELSLDQMVKKRKAVWEAHKSPELDKQITDAIAKRIKASDELLRQVEKNPHKLIECCFCVIDKNMETVPFFFNEVQRDFVNKLETQGRSKPYFILKGRQQGFTTLITAIQLSNAIIKRNFSGFTIADREDNTKAIFYDKAKIMYNNLPQVLKLNEKYNSTNELVFDDLNSSWRIASASANIGRSRTLSFVHFSEIAFYKCTIADLQKSIVEATTEDAYCIYETTANGFNDAKELWDTGYCHNLFYGWWRTKEYVSQEYQYLDYPDKWLKNRLKSLEKMGLSKDQQAWYAKKYSSYIDKSAIRQEYPCSPEEAFIVTGECVFDKDAIGNYLSTFDVKSTKGYFEYEKRLIPIENGEGKVEEYATKIVNVRFIPDENGYISIVEKPYSKSKNGSTYQKPYVIGADTAGEGEDYFTAKVLDNTTGKCVATLHKKRLDEDLFAEQLYCLGTYYNNAFLGIEINYSRYPVYHLRKLGYENIYSDLYNPKTAPPDKTRRYGFLTDSNNRPMLISHLVRVMREDLGLETDRETLKELCSFIRHKNGKCAAASGAHDDLVMASAIAHYIRRRFTCEMQIIDTGSDFLDELFKDDTEENNQFMEW